MRIGFALAVALTAAAALVGGVIAAPAPPETAPPETAAPPAAAPVAPGNAQRSAAKEENKEIIELRDVHAVLGKEVRSATGEAMGRIVNVLIDGSGKPRAAVIDFGGFLGVGIRKIAVDWEALQFSPYQDYQRIIAALTRDQVKAAPEFKDEQQAVQAIGISGPTAGP